MPRRFSYLTRGYDPHDFIAKWRGNALKERSASQSHFNDLIRSRVPLNCCPPPQASD